LKDHLYNIPKSSCYSFKQSEKQLSLKEFLLIIPSAEQLYNFYHIVQAFLWT